MTQTVSMRPDLTQAAAAAVSDCRHGDRLWRVSERFKSLLGSGPDWFDLRNEPGATLIKRNSQRDVYRVEFDGRAYFAKLYHPNGLAAKIKLLVRGPMALREWDVGMYAAAHNIAAVLPAAMAWSGSRADGRPSLLVTEGIPDVKPLNDFWVGVRDDCRRANNLIESLARLIARAHQCGFHHKDMHPGNILVRGVGEQCETFFVDLHDVRVGAAVSLGSVVANLAQLNQWFRRNATRSQRRRFLKHYVTYRDCYAQASAFARNWRMQPDKLVPDLARQADRHANKLWAKRDRRTKRTGRYFAKIKPAPGWCGHVLLQSKHPGASAVAARQTYTAQQWKTWFCNPLDFVDTTRQKLLKDSHTATVCKAWLDTGDQRVAVIVKRPLARNIVKRIDQLLFRSRNMRSWKLANMLLNRDLPAAQPLAVVERYALGLFRVDSISLTDYIADSVDLETFLTRDIAAMDAKRQWRVKRKLTASLVQLVKAFHDRGFVHRDFKATNLLVNFESPDSTPPRLTFIDMDGIRHAGCVCRMLRMRAVMRLCASLLGSPGCTRTDRLRFLMRYLLGPGRTADDWKDHWRRLDAMVGDKLRTKQKRRQWKLDNYGRE